MNMTNNPASLSLEMPPGDRYLLYGVAAPHSFDARSILEVALAAKVSIVEVDGLQVAVRLISNPLEFNQAITERMNEFGDALSILHRLGDILPFRFGTIITSEELFKYLAPQKEDLLRTLEQIAGCTEINVRWAIPNETLALALTSNSALSPLPMTGAEYLNRKRQSLLSDQQITVLVAKAATGLQSLMGADCVATKSNISSTKVLCPEIGCERTYTIARVDLLVQRKSQTQMMHCALSTLFRSVKPAIVSGPWPPFSFVAFGAKSANNKARTTRENKMIDCQKANA
jgi:Gas vesicle synthesis protein GvpL/GvpF